MATPIDPSPVLRGADAEELLRQLSDTASSEDIAKRKAASREFLEKSLQSGPGLDEMSVVLYPSVAPGSEGSMTQAADLMQAYGAAPMPGSDRVKVVSGSVTLTPWPIEPAPAPLPTWELAGNCRACGAPIFSRQNRQNPVEPPEVHWKCKCAPATSKPKKKRASKR